MEGSVSKIVQFNKQKRKDVKESLTTDVGDLSIELDADISIDTDESKESEHEAQQETNDTSPTSNDTSPEQAQENSETSPQTTPTQAQQNGGKPQDPSQSPTAQGSEAKNQTGQGGSGGEKGKSSTPQSENAGGAQNDVSNGGKKTPSGGYSRSANKSKDSDDAEAMRQKKENAPAKEPDQTDPQIASQDPQNQPEENQTLPDQAPDGGSSVPEEGGQPAGAGAERQQGGGLKTMGRNLTEKMLADPTARPASPSGANTERIKNQLGGPNVKPTQGGASGGEQENQEKEKPVKQRALPMKGVNYLRHRKELKQDKKRIGELKKANEKLQKKLDPIQKKIDPIDRRLFLERAKRSSYVVTGLVLLLVSGLLALTVVLLPVAGAVFGAAGRFWYLVARTSMNIKKFKAQLKPLEKMRSLVQQKIDANNKKRDQLTKKRQMLINRGAFQRKPKAGG